MDIHQMYAKQGSQNGDSMLPYKNVDANLVNEITKRIDKYREQFIENFTEKVLRFNSLKNKGHVPSWTFSFLDKSTAADDTTCSEDKQLNQELTHILDNEVLYVEFFRWFSKNFLLGVEVFGENYAFAHMEKEVQPVLEVVFKDKVDNDNKVDFQTFDEWLAANFYRSIHKSEDGNFPDNFQYRIGKADQNDDFVPFALTWVFDDLVLTKKTETSYGTKDIVDGGYKAHYIFGFPVDRKALVSAT